MISTRRLIAVSVGCVSVYVTPEGVNLVPRTFPAPPPNQGKGPGNEVGGGGVLPEKLGGGGWAAHFPKFLPDL